MPPALVGKWEACWIVLPPFVDVEVVYFGTVMTLYPWHWKTEPEYDVAGAFGGYSYKWERGCCGMSTQAISEAAEKIGVAEGQPKPMSKGKEVILEILGRAADDSKFLARLADDPGEALGEYYTLTSEEWAALASGDIKKIEGWVGKLDRRLATWLWCRLSQEKW